MMRARASLIFLFLFAAPGLRGQDTTDPFVLYPAPLDLYEYRGAIGADLTVLPRLVVEEQVRQSPMLDYRARFGLPWGFSLHGFLGTNVLTTVGSLGASWNSKTESYAFGLGAALVYWYGFATFEGFDVTASSWLLRPNASFGVEFERVRLSVHAALQIVTARTTRSNGLDVSNQRNQLTGASLGFVVEQPFFGTTHAAIGMRIYRSRAMYQAWLAFTAFNEYLLYPEFTFAIIH